MTNPSASSRPVRALGVVAVACSVLVILAWIGFGNLQDEVLANDAIENFGLFVPLIGSLVLTAVLWTTASIVAVIAIVRSDRNTRVVIAVIASAIVAVVVACLPAVVRII